MSLQKAFNSRWFTNVLQSLTVSLLIFFGTSIKNTWEKWTTQTETNTQDITLLKLNDVRNSRQVENTRLDVDVIKQHLIGVDADLKSLKHERVDLSAYKPNASFLPSPTSIRIDTDNGRRGNPGKDWFPLAAVFDYRRTLWAPGWLHHSGYEPDDLH